MSVPELPVAELDQERVAQLRQLEEETGAQIVAYQPEPRMAGLSDEAVAKIQEFEVANNVVLLAYVRQQ